MFLDIYTKTHNMIDYYDITNILLFIFENLIVYR